jgi:hypothetical protein
MGNQYQPQYQTQVTVCEATASMICGIVSLVCFGIILGPIAIFLGLSAKKQIKENPYGLTGDCQATAGIVTGSIVDVSNTVGERILKQNFDFILHIQVVVLHLFWSKSFPNLGYFCPLGARL